MTTITADVHPQVVADLEALVAANRAGDPTIKLASVSELASYVLICVAQGSREPDSWARGLLDMMGIAP